MQASKILWCHPNCYFRPTTVLEVFDNEGIWPCWELHQECRFKTWRIPFANEFLGQHRSPYGWIWFARVVWNCNMRVTVSSICYQGRLCHEQSGGICWCVQRWTQSLWQTPIIYHCLSVLIAMRSRGPTQTQSRTWQMLRSQQLIKKSCLSRI